MAGVFHAVFWDAGAWAIAALTAWLDVLARLPSASLWVPRAPAWAAACGVAGGLLFVMRLPWTLRCMGVPLMLPVLLWQPVRPGVGQFELLAADVGQGNAVIVRTAHHTLVYDAGPRWGPESDAGARVLLPLLRASGDRVDMLVLSHRDSDHSGGAAAVLAAWPRAAFLSSLEAAHELQSLRPATRCVAGQRWQWDGVEFEILHPAANAYAAAHKPNAVSCVLRVAASGESVLLAGDIEQAQERQLQAQLIASRVLLVPHHGSKTSSSAAFIDAVRPTVALVQAGWRNRFGHPAPAVIDRYQQRGVQVVETARCGAVHWHSREPHRVGCERLRRPRYWRHAVDPGLP